MSVDLTGGYHLRWKDGDEVLTLWPEKGYEDGWVVGWCPERKNNIAVHPSNILGRIEPKQVTPR
jgi:hypothetical protein